MLCILQTIYNFCTLEGLLFNVSLTENSHFEVTKAIPK